ncbi:MAG: NAD(P)/FAD-dependent oxidoreductase [Aeromicrobium sp.]
MVAVQHDTQPAEQDERVLDAVVLGAGVTGIHQLHRLREDGLDVIAIDAASGVGGTWFWNRYPGARVDSESYSYQYFFSKDLLEEWNWTEHFAGQPENERYVNHVVDKFGLRDRILLDTTIAAATWIPGSEVWELRSVDGRAFRTKFLVTAVGFLSDPQYPQTPGQDAFAGESYHTGVWPVGGVDFTGKRVAVIGTGSSGVQLIQSINEDVASMTVFQRTPNWATPLNNEPISAEELADIKARYDEIYASTQNPGGFVHNFPETFAAEHTPEQRREFWEDLWTKRGFATLFGNYPEVSVSVEVNQEFADFIAEKVRDRVDDPEIAAKLIPTDHGYAFKRPPMETNYYEVYNQDNVELVDVRENPILEITETGIKTQQGDYELDMIVYATGFDVGTGSFTKIDFTGIGGEKLKEQWANGPVTRMGMFAPGFPNMLMVGGVQALVGNIPRTTEHQVEFVAHLMEHMRNEGLEHVEVTREAADEWVQHLAESVVGTIFDGANSWLWGSNTPGKARSFLLYAGGLLAYNEWLEKTETNGYEGLELR